MRTTRCIKGLQVALLSFLLITACAPGIDLEQQIPDPPEVRADRDAFAAEWQKYADEINERPRQKGCRPRIVHVPTSVARRGAVVMFHGFGGCPQQLFELSKRVSSQGFDVLLPLSPGHGLKQKDGKDDLSRLPAADGDSRYAGLAQRMNQIMSYSPGARVVVGFSLGGAISLNANLQSMKLYDRQLLISPMLAIRGGAFVEGLAGFLGRVPGIQNIVVKPAGRRDECRDWQTAGRAGFCDYQIKHVVALLSLESLNQALYEQQTLKTPVQIVAAGDENYVSNDKITSFTDQQRANGPISLCFMPDDVPHEMLSVYENTGRDMYWLEGLLSNAVRFIADGRVFPNDSDFSPEATDQPLCEGIH
jgi:pimeloyl-ACP methyl ester carboxylesterase